MKAKGVAIRRPEQHDGEVVEIRILKETGRIETFHLHPDDGDAFTLEIGGGDNLFFVTSQQARAELSCL